MSSILKAKQTKFGLYALVYTAIVLGVLGLLNFLANRHNQSLDLTANKRFTLSDQTLKVANDLKQDVKITYFDRTTAFSAPAGPKDLLDRYDNLSPKISIEYIDPEKKPTVAKAMGVRNFGATFIETNGRREEAKSVSEEELTGAIIRALKGGARTVCSITGSGEHTFENTEREGYSNIKEYLERNNYKTREISLLAKAEVPADCTVVMVGGPRRDYLEPAVTALKNYVEAGGRALVMLDPPIKLARDETDENAALTKLLADWGVTLNKDLVLELSPVGRLFGLGPEMPLVNKYEAHAVVRNMRDAASAMPLTRSMEVKGGGKTTVEKLFATSDNSVSTPDLSAAEIKVEAANNKKGPFVLAAAGTYNTGKEKLEGRFVVTGSSLFLANGYLRFGGNRDLAVNMMNWLSQDEDLISIRPKDPEDRRVNMSASQMRTFFFMLLAVPVAIIGWGLAVWNKRR
ncbi:MAG: GldG family protein [Bryobacterales bacterium]|nr:GldG family protein [Bryobacterales bacterium]